MFLDEDLSSAGNSFSMMTIRSAFAITDTCCVAARGAIGSLGDMCNAKLTAMESWRNALLFTTIRSYCIRRRCAQILERRRRLVILVAFMIIEHICEVVNHRDQRYYVGQNSM